MCSGSEADSYLRLIDFVYDSTLGLRIIKKKYPDEKRDGGVDQLHRDRLAQRQTPPDICAPNSGIT